MAKIIPNKNSWIGFITAAANPDLPTGAEVLAATDVTKLVISITASAQGNTVPTPSLDELFETSIPGTSAAQFSADFYRDDSADTAWTTLTRAKKGWFVISRFGTLGATPVAGDKVEVWPVTVTSRAAGPLSSNTAQTFTLTCAVTEAPAEEAVVVTLKGSLSGAGTALPATPAKGDAHTIAAPVPTAVTALFAGIAAGATIVWNGTAWTRVDASTFSIAEDEGPAQLEISDALADDGDAEA